MIAQEVFNGLLPLVRQSKSGTLRAFNDRGLNIASLQGPTDPDGRPREFKITLWHRGLMGLIPEALQPYAYGGTMWQHMFSPEAQFALLELEWMVVDPLPPLVRLAQQVEEE